MVLQYGLQDPSREEFGEYFPEMDADMVDALYDAYQQALALVRSHCQEEYQLICAEQQVADQLRALDQLEQAPQGQQPSGLGATPLSGLRTTPSHRTPGGRTPGSRRTPAAEAIGQAPSESVVRDAEAVARQYALRQEAAHLRDLLEKARRTENRLSLTLAMRQETVAKITAAYQQAVSDTKQVYDITRAWPSAPRLKGTSE